MGKPKSNTQNRRKKKKIRGKNFSFVNEVYVQVQIWTNYCGENNGNYLFHLIITRGRSGGGGVSTTQKNLLI